ncbi:MAG TPA: hypothetical protein VLA71_11050 [Algoriphagus sp.]|nr:hypothetical protein [Algoriphagus sp.]
MANFLFHRCGMHHEEFQLFSSPQDFSTLWKRNPLCPKEIRSANLFCSHGSALLRLISESVGLSPEILAELIRLQNQLFAIDHQKGELEKYVFEKEEAIRINCQEKLKELNQEYHLICDQIQVILADEANKQAVKIPTPNK